MHRPGVLASLAGTIMLSAVIPIGSGAAMDPVTLRFAVADDSDAPSAPYARAFVDEVATRSGGSITIDVIWDAGRTTRDGFEMGTARRLVDGDVDLALAASRAWTAVGIGALEPLQAPFLIDTDALAETVAMGDIASGLLAAMDTGGVTGLAMWPEDLRHFVAYEQCIAPVTSPDDLRGRTIRAVPSVITLELVAALGATHSWEVGSLWERVETCAMQAQESGFLQRYPVPGIQTVTGDVTLFPKFQVIAANGAAFERLAPDQQAAIRVAATAVARMAVGERLRDGDAAARWCADGGRVVFAGADGLAAFRAVAQPVFDGLRSDPAAAAAIDAIEMLKAATPTTTRVAPCEPPGSPGPAAGAGATIIPRPGAYRVHVTREDTARYNAHPSNGGTITLTFTEDTWRIEWASDSPGGPGYCGGPWELVDGDTVMRLTATAGDCHKYWSEVVWSDAGGDLVGRVVRVELPAEIADDRAWVESHPWVPID
jgi:C4-dicarboxylate-binding protein DctP